VRVRVRLFALAREAAGRSEVEAELGEGATVASLLEALGASYPRLGPLAPSLLVAVNREYRGRDALLRDGDEVGIIPPVSGGEQESAKGSGGSSGEKRGRYPRIARMKMNGAGACTR
jgi:molybdopterin converting factor subunit 1